VQYIVRVWSEEDEECTEAICPEHVPLHSSFQSPHFDRANCPVLRALLLALALALHSENCTLSKLKTKTTQSLKVKEREEVEGVEEKVVVVWA
jgi:hypothetical protein